MSRIVDVQTHPLLFVPPKIVPALQRLGWTVEEKQPRTYWERVRFARQLCEPATLILYGYGDPVRVDFVLEGRRFRKILPNSSTYTVLVRAPSLVIAESAREPA